MKILLHLAISVHVLPQKPTRFLCPVFRNAWNPPNNIPLFEMPICMINEPFGVICSSRKNYLHTYLIRQWGRNLHFLLCSQGGKRCQLSTKESQLQYAFFAISRQIRPLVCKSMLCIIFMTSQKSKISQRVNGFNYPLGNCDSASCKHYHTVAYSNVLSALQMQQVCGKHGISSTINFCRNFKKKSVNKLP